MSLLDIANVLLRPVDLYCERTSPDFWAEPVNALTNLAFFVAGALVWRSAPRVARGAWDVRLLAVLLCLIGTGSFLFHTTAVVLTLILDVLFIAIFVHSFFVIFLIRVAGWQWWQAAAGVIALILAGYPMRLICSGGTCSYVPSLAAVIFLGMLALRKKSPGTPYLFAAAAVFVVSLTFRSIDGAICERFPLGTHFVWHLLNATVLYVATTGLIRARTTG